jgi:hypothetical protein
MTVPIPNPNGCCDIATCCPGNTLTGTLMATIEAIDDCVCADGTAIPLIWDGLYAFDGSTSWNSGVVDFGTCLNPSPPPTYQQLSISLLCVANGPCAFSLVLNGACCGTVEFTDPVCSGCPGEAFSLVFDNLAGFANCCRNMPPPPAIMRITITES